MSLLLTRRASQGREALFLQYIGRKIIVVGDDKQISPEAVGFDREDVAVLRQRFISDLPHNDAIGVDNSFFDLAEIHYQERIPSASTLGVCPRSSSSQTTCGTPPSH